MGDVRIAIIGGGPSGLISLCECKKRNIRATIFEKAGQIGGVWNLASSNSFAHSSTVLESSSFVNSYNLDFNLFDFLKSKYRKEYVDYATSTDFNEYLVALVDHYDLASMISLNTEIVDIISGEPGQRFTLKTINVLSKEEKVHLFDYVIIASGLHGIPITPDEPFLSQQLKMNEGTIFHTTKWDPLNEKSSSSKIMESKAIKVLVTGSSYGSTDAIQDTINHAQNNGNYKNLKIYWAPTRSPENRNVWLFSLYPFRGKQSPLPFDETVNRYTYMFPNMVLAKKIKEASIPVSIPIENEILNLNRDRFSFIQNDVIVDSLQDQTVQLLPEAITRIYRTSSSQLAFDTKSSKETLVDAVVIGSGFTHRQPKINGKHIYKYSSSYKYIIPIDKSYSGRLGFLCTVDIFGSMISMTQMEVKWLLFQWFDKNSNLDKNLEIMRSQYSNIKDEQPLMDILGPRMDDLAKDMNVCPSIWRNLLSLQCRQRHIALACIFGPWSIYQYATVDETDSERQKREDLLLMSTKYAYKKCGQSFRFICVMSDMAYYMSLTAILAVWYMNYDFMKEKIMSTFDILLKKIF